MKNNKRHFLTNLVSTGRTKYKYVRKLTYSDHIRYQSNIKGISKYFETEREAAIYVDKILIELGKEPVNILKRKI